MISTGDFKKGQRILVDGEPFTIDSLTVQTPSARGAATLVRCKLRNIVTGVLIERTFKGGEKFEVPDLIKGIRGTSSEDHDFENLAKGMLRAKYNLCVNFSLDKRIVNIRSS